MKRTQDLIKGNADFQLSTEAYLQSGLKKLRDDAAADNIARSEREAAARIEAEQRLLAASASVFNSLSQLAEEGSAEQRGLALAGIAVDTASALAGGIASAQDIPYPGNLAAMASTIAIILANIAQAKQIAGFAEGGWTGPGSKYQAVGIVHADEYVTPKKVVNMPAAKPHISALESMRVKGYADGGFVTNQNVSSTNQALITANAFKNIPPAVVSVQEITRTQTRIRVKENVSTL